MTLVEAPILLTKCGGVLRLREGLSNESRVHVRCPRYSNVHCAQVDTLSKQTQQHRGALPVKHMDSPPHTHPFSLIIATKNRIKERYKALTTSVDVHVGNNHFCHEKVIKNMEHINLDVPKNRLDPEWGILVLKKIAPISDVVYRRCQRNPPSFPKNSRSSFVTIAVPNSA